jgi:diaminopimelate epimerase
MALRGVARELTAIAEGGAQRTVWPANDAAMMLTGPAEIVCQGEAFQAEAPKAQREAESF